MSALNAGVVEVKPARRPYADFWAIYLYNLINMLLNQLAKTAGIRGNFSGEVKGITGDSRRVKKGFVFFALKGEKTDGNRFTAKAVEKGAAAVVSENLPPAGFPPGILWLRTKNVPKALSAFSAAFYGFPSKKFKVVGITGTNGKTTVSYVIEGILKEAGIKSGVMGTVNHRIGGKMVSESENTTPFAHELQRILALMAEKKVGVAAMEVSSHALSLSRADDVEFDAAVFTNLQRDHLDFHKNREAYFRAKAGLFRLLTRSGKRNKFAVLNFDDPRGRRLAGMFRGKFAITGFAAAGRADWEAKDIKLRPDGAVFTLRFPKGEMRVSTPLMGKYNVMNALAAAAVCSNFGVGIEIIRRALAKIGRVPGRLERVSGPGFGVFVDYAHTDAALENVLENLRDLPRRKVITVFGCGGDRDRTKRPAMGRVACRLSDEVIITDDNPRSEDPRRIFADIEKGIRGLYKNYRFVSGRRKAIREAVASAGRGDMVLIAGKGHETYQVTAKGKIHFDDREEARKAIERRKS